MSFEPLEPVRRGSGFLPDAAAIGHHKQGRGKTSFIIRLGSELAKHMGLDPRGQRQFVELSLGMGADAGKVRLTKARQGFRCVMETSGAATIKPGRKSGEGVFRQDAPFTYLEEDAIERDQTGIILTLPDEAYEEDEDEA